MVLDFLEKNLLFAAPSPSVPSENQEFDSGSDNQFLWNGWTRAKHNNENSYCDKKVGEGVN